MRAQWIINSKWLNEFHLSIVVTSSFSKSPQSQDVLKSLPCLFSNAFFSHSAWAGPSLGTTLIDPTALGAWCVPSSLLALEIPVRGSRHTAPIGECHSSSKMPEGWELSREKGSGLTGYFLKFYIKYSRPQDVMHLCTACFSSKRLKKKTYLRGPVCSFKKRVLSLHTL